MEQVDGKREVGAVGTAVAQWFAVRLGGSAGSFVGGAVQFGAGLTAAEVEMQSEGVAEGARFAASFPATVDFGLAVTAAAAAAAGIGSSSAGCLEPERSGHAADCFGSKGLARSVECTSEGCLTLAEFGSWAGS